MPPLTIAVIDELADWEFAAEHLPAQARVLGHPAARSSSVELRFPRTGNVQFGRMK